MSMRLRSALAISALIASWGVSACGTAPNVTNADSLPRTLTAPVIRAVDGDTILARVDGQSEYVRYIGIDTPETVKPDTPVQCFGPQASAFNHHAVEGHTVRLVFDRERRDDYGRLLAYVYLGREMINADLVRRGFARTLPFPPNTSHAGLFERLARRAAVHGRGLWDKC
jgi:micrococcal nuclease